MKDIFRKNIYFYVPALVFLILLGIHVIYSGKEQAFLSVNHWRSYWLDTLMPYVTFMGDGWFAAILVILFSVMPFKKQVNLFVSWMSAFLLVTILKNLVFPGALRPMAHFYEKNYLVLHPADLVIHTSHSFPSGHTASAFAVFAILAYYTSSRSLKFIYFLFAVFAGWSRIYLGQHFAEDVWVGALIGMVVSLLVLYLLRNVRREESSMELLGKKLKKNVVIISCNDKDSFFICQ